MGDGTREFYCLRLHRPKHPAVKRRWRKWCGDVRVEAGSNRVFIVDGMHPPHLMTRLPPIGSAQCFEHDGLAFVDIDWGIKNAADAAEREHYAWLKSYILARLEGHGAAPTLPPDYPRVSGRGRNMTLKLEDGRHYQVGAEPAEFLRTLRHLASKTWCDEEFLELAIARVAAARQWDAQELADEFERPTRSPS